MSLVKQDIRKKWQIDKSQPELDKGDGKTYKNKAIHDSKIYIKKSNYSLLSGLYYFVS